MNNEEHALALDAAETTFRDRFEFPTRGDTPLTYFCGNSLGLLPTATRAVMQQELDAWSQLGVDGHFEAERPWYSYHEVFSEKMARVVGANARDVVVMNGLTTNLHLLMASFYQPSKHRYKICIAGGEFPSDRYAVHSQTRFHGYEDAVLEIEPRAGEHSLRDEDIFAFLDKHGHEIALVLFSGVHYYTGQLFPLGEICKRAREHGCAVGLDLAHAAGNVELKLSEWSPDFAAWCTYKYLNSGPGATAGAFVAERHNKRDDLPRFEGWWGTDPETRFEMGPSFIPQAGAGAWQTSNAPVFSMAPLVASLDIFDEATMPKLAERSRALTGYLHEQLSTLIERGAPFSIITPASHGAQLSLLFSERGREVQQALQAAGVVVDYRDPGVLRAAPTPLYNSFHDVWRLSATVADVLGVDG